MQQPFLYIHKILANITDIWSAQKKKKLLRGNFVDVGINFQETVLRKDYTKTSKLCLQSYKSISIDF